MKNLQKMMRAGVLTSAALLSGCYEPQDKYLEGKVIGEYGSASIPDLFTGNQVVIFASPAPDCITDTTAKYKLPYGPQYILQVQATQGTDHVIIVEGFVGYPTLEQVVNYVEKGKVVGFPTKLGGKDLFDKNNVAEIPASFINLHH